MGKVFRECDAAIHIDGQNVQGEFSSQTGSSRGFPKPGLIQVELDCSQTESGGCGRTERCQVESLTDVARTVGNLLLETCPKFQGIEMRESIEFDPETIASNTRRTLIAGSILYFAERDAAGVRQWHTDSVSTFDYGGEMPVNLSQARRHLQHFEAMGLVELSRTTGPRHTARWSAQLVDSELWDQVAELPEVASAIEQIHEAVSAEQVINVRQDVVTISSSNRRRRL